MQLPIDAGRNQIFINKTESKTLKARAEKVGKILKYRCLNDLQEAKTLKAKAEKVGKHECSGMKGKKNPKQSLSKIFLTALETQAPMLINPSTGALDWIPNQLLHSDTDPNNGMSWTSDQFIGLVVATTAGTMYVRVITGSHHRKDDDYRKRKYIHVIALQQYDYFVAKPTLIHGGSTNKPYKDDDPSCDDSFAAANMTRRSMKGTVPLSTIKLSSGEQYSDVKQFRNTRLHFYYNIPTAATNQTYFLVDNQAAHLQIIDCTATDMFNV
jgi:hypothetical protein